MRCKTIAIIKYYRQHFNYIEFIVFFYVLDTNVFIYNCVLSWCDITWDFSWTAPIMRHISNIHETSSLVVAISKPVPVGHAKRRFIEIIHFVTRRMNFIIYMGKENIIIVQLIYYTLYIRYHCHGYATATIVVIITIVIIIIVIIIIVVIIIVIIILIIIIITIMIIISIISFVASFVVIIMQALQCELHSKQLTMH